MGAAPRGVGGCAEPAPRGDGRAGAVRAVTSPVPPGAAWGPDDVAGPCAVRVAQGCHGPATTAPAASTTATTAATTLAFGLGMTAPSELACKSTFIYSPLPGRTSTVPGGGPCRRGFGDAGDRIRRRESVRGHGL